jgi:hypothetical protein
MTTDVGDDRRDDQLAPAPKSHTLPSLSLRGVRTSAITFAGPAPKTQAGRAREEGERGWAAALLARRVITAGGHACCKLEGVARIRQAELNFARGTGKGLVS